MPRRKRRCSKNCGGWDTRPASCAKGRRAMANAETSMEDIPPAPGRAPAVAEPPLAAYRGALARYGVDRLRAIAAAVGIAEPGARTAAALAGQIAEYLESSRAIGAVLARLEHGARLALGLFALTEAASWPLAGLAHALECLGV